MNARTEMIVEAIRGDEIVGRGSGSVVDACMDDRTVGIAYGFDRETGAPASPEQAVEYARRAELDRRELELESEHRTDRAKAVAEVEKLTGGIIRDLFRLSEVLEEIAFEEDDPSPMERANGDALDAEDLIWKIRDALELEESGVSVRR